ncbi:hypothetical protein TcasGA2_TC032564 [Tribolium castaneum]|uniref:Uncharacterized protein n=1 Tax=Tribolium castaneum TaxID=7070 RepID=A0A139WKT5_TRICA|nr:hypothetical protein TcasGA2_TC032564 [Tribolium castaneum]
MTKSFCKCICLYRLFVYDYFSEKDILNRLGFESGVQAYLF